MAVAYDIIIPRPDGVPASIVVRITAMREDGKPLSREELEALAKAYPPPDDETRTAVDAAIARAPSRPSKGTSTKPRKPASKRAAAKR